MGKKLVLLLALLSAAVKNSAVQAEQRCERSLTSVLRSLCGVMGMERSTYPETETQVLFQKQILQCN